MAFVLYRLYFVSSNANPTPKSNPVLKKINENFVTENK